MHPQEFSLTNGVSVLTVDFYGGAIKNFSLIDAPINPLSFLLNKNEMPPNNQAGAPYQGHFICLGRWGRPTEGEIRMGLPDHGQFANMEWSDAGCDAPGRVIRMEARSPLEGLHLYRTILLDHHSPVIRVDETVSNTSAWARFYQAVQHPTLSVPFLGNDVIICSNAGAGFNQMHAVTPGRYARDWPDGISHDGTVIRLDKFDQPYNSVFSYVVQPGDVFGWMTCYSPRHNLLFGYLWPRAMYPWIIVWKHWEEDQLVYLGLEFGTTGLPYPMHRLVEDGNTVVFNEKTYAFLDAGDSADRHYYAFLHRPQIDATRITGISFTPGRLHIRSGADTEEIAAPTVCPE